MKSQKPGNSLGPGPEVLERQGMAIERAEQRVCSWTLQNEMRSVLGPMTAGGAAMDSRFCRFRRDKSLREGFFHCSEDEKGHKERDEGAQVSQWTPRKLECQRI